MKAKTQVAFAVAIVVLGSLSGALTSTEASARNYHPRNGYRSASTLPAGASFDVRVDTKISTETAHSGDSWTGTLAQSVVSGDRVMFPAGSQVTGVVTSAAQGTHSSRAQLGLAVRGVLVNGRTYPMNADARPIIAGTSRARKLGAIAGGAAVGALLGHTVARDNHGTLVGGLVGGAAGYGLTRNAFRTLELQPGTVLSFTTRQQVAINR